MGAVREWNAGLIRTKHIMSIYNIFKLFKNLVYIHYGILSSLKPEENTDVCGNMDKLGIY